MIILGMSTSVNDSIMDGENQHVIIMLMAWIILLRLIEYIIFDTPQQFIKNSICMDKHGKPRLMNTQKPSTAM